jgi:hypothetical protein
VVVDEDGGIDDVLLDDGGGIDDVLLDDGGGIDDVLLDDGGGIDDVLLDEAVVDDPPAPKQNVIVENEGGRGTGLGRPGAS